MKKPIILAIIIAAVLVLVLAARVDAASEIGPCGCDRCTAVNITDDITTKTNLPAEAVEEILPEQLKPYAQNFVDGEQEYGVNMLFIMAIAKQETSSGTAGVGKSKNNLFGVKGDGGYRAFEDFGASVDNQFRMIREVYFDSGRTTIGSMAQIYCVPPEHWSGAVSGIFAGYVEKAEGLAE